jgi:uncharacterized protein (DUF305 family)
MRPTAERIVAAIAVLVTATVVSACGGTSSTDQHAGHTGTNPAQGAQPVKHNADDVDFARNMIPHHQQAVDMSAMVPSRSTNPKVIVMAKHISMDQQAEIQMLQGLLAQWGEPEMSDNAGHGGMAIDGMVDEATMSRLGSLSGSEFDKLWLTSMIAHHRGAITMAQVEIAHGQNPDAVKKAKLIVDAQEIEIAQMNHLLSVPE